MVTASLQKSVRLQPVIAVTLLILALVAAVYMSRHEAILAPLWILGLAAGFTLQRSRFCFASAFRDLFLFGSGRVMKGILIGLAVSTIGFSITMYNQVPFPSFGTFPPQANILPVGLSTVIAGILFGFGMVLAGGCVSGSLYRMAEGYVGSWVTIGGVIVGMGLLAQTWNWWWTTLISNEPKLWLPAQMNLGYGGAVSLTLSVLLVLFLLILWWESRSGLSLPDAPTPTANQDSLREKLSGLGNSIFVRGWPAITGGVILGGITLLMFMVHMPWGVTGELARWSNALMTTVGVPAPSPLGLDSLGGCAGRAAETGILSHTFAVTVGVLPGSLVAAFLSREFKLRFPKNAKRYLQSLGGGIVMGYGAALAIGCTVGAFFSSVPSLSISAWLFALALAGGAFLGILVIKRIG